MKQLQTFTYEEAFEASLEYFKGDQLAARVWVTKYALKDSFGNIYERTPDDMHWRIAKSIAEVENSFFLQLRTTNLGTIPLTVG